MQSLNEVPKTILAVKIKAPEGNRILDGHAKVGNIGKEQLRTSGLGNDDGGNRTAIGEPGANRSFKSGEKAFVMRVIALGHIEIKE